MTSDAPNAAASPTTAANPTAAASRAAGRVGGGSRVGRVGGGGGVSADGSARASASAPGAAGSASALGSASGAAGVASAADVAGVGGVGGAAGVGASGPGLLRPGDRVVVVSPAGPCPSDLLDAGIAWLRTWDLDVQVDTHALDTHPTLDYLAGHDTDRARALEQAWLDPTVTGVLCARGGYGSLRMVDLVDWPALAAAATITTSAPLVAPPLTTASDAPVAAPFTTAAHERRKVFVGSSDITVLHERFWSHGIPTWFGPMIGTRAFVEDTDARERLHAALFTGVTSYRGVGLAPGTARGIAVGGNLSLLDTPPPPGAIVLLEDVNEEPYRLDRMLTGLLRSGWFDQVAGLVLGSWTGCGDPTTVLADRLRPLGVPIVADARFGHCAGQLTVPLGVPVTIDGDTGLVTVIP